MSCLECYFHGPPVSDYTGPHDMCAKCIASGKCSEQRTVPFVGTSHRKEETYDTDHA